MERRPIHCLGFLLPPMPQFAQDRRGPTTQRAGAADPPHFIRFSIAVAGGQFDCALTGLTEPIDPTDR